MAARPDRFLPSRPGGPRRRGGLVAAAFAAAAVTAAGGAVPALARTPQPAPSPSAAHGAGTAATGTNDATKAHTAYLKAHAPADHMGLSLALSRAASSVARAGVPMLPARADPVYGDDVSSHQGQVNWGQAAANGGKFAYVKATEGTYYTNPDFSQQYSGSYGAGMTRGAYAFAIPSYSSGTSQAGFFVSHGGGWSRDGRTLPGVLDIESNPYGPKCYKLSQSVMVTWIRSFTNEYLALTGRRPVIYTSTAWWSACTGNYGGFAADPLWIVHPASGPGTLPAGWTTYAFWQYANSGPLPGDQDVFNGSSAALTRLADGT